MRGLFLAAALLVTALASVPTASATPSCDADVNEDGRYGAGCHLFDTCYSIVWGYHSEFLTVGGGSSCSGGVWVNPDEQPEDPVPPTVDDWVCNVQNVVAC